MQGDISLGPCQMRIDSQQGDCQMFVVIESCYKVETRKSRELLQFIGNKLFHQEWITDGDSDFSMPSRRTINATSKTFIT